MNKNIIWLVIIWLPIKIFSQTIANPYVTTQDKLTSPQVHLLKQFVDHPVDLSRGLVDISIPIYDIKFGNKTIPIKLMFHSSGLQANLSENGILGLKWTLNGSGFISREVRGYPDDLLLHRDVMSDDYCVYNQCDFDWTIKYGATEYRGYFANNIIFSSDLGYNNGELGYPAGTVGRYEDTEYDIFTFSLPTGDSGKFILKDTNGNKSASFMPYKPFKLNNNPSKENFFNSDLYGWSDTYSKFEFVDDEGYLYTFGKNDLGIKYYETTIHNEYVNNWLLTSIVSPNKKDTLKFEYNSKSVYVNTSLVPVVINDNVDNNYWFYPAGCEEATTNSGLWDALESILYDYSGVLQKNYNEPVFDNKATYYLSKITYNDLSVDYSYVVSNDDINDLSLSKIKITKGNTILKEANFDVISPGGALINNGLEYPSYLNSVSIKGDSNGVIEKYSFDYYHLDKLPLMDKLANKADYWGYYNSEVENVILKDSVEIYTTPMCGSLTPSRIINAEIGAGNNRYSNAEDMKIGMIKTITYPTGGKTNFDYEANQYKEGDTIRKCGGLRIKSIVSKEANGKDLKTKFYTYGQNEDGVGEIPIYLKPTFYPFRNYFEEVKTEHLIFEDGISNPLDYGVEFLNYTTRNFSGFFPGNFYTFLDKLVSYDKVTEYLGDNNKNIGKIENIYSINIPLHRDYEFNHNNFKYQYNKFCINPINFWQGNHLSSKIEYKNSNNIYTKIRETDYSYNSTIVEEINDLSVYKFKNFVGYASSGQPSYFVAKNELLLVKYYPGEYYGYKPQKYTIGVENLTEIKEKLYFGNDSIVQTTTNIYDTNKPTFLKESQVINSRGKNITQKYLYPFDINTGVYSEMTTANVISPLVEKVSLNDTNVTGSALLTYKKSDDNFVPDKNYAAQLNTPIPLEDFAVFNGLSRDSSYGTDPENTYDSYDDYGNPTQITSKGKATTVYIWGYNKQYPIAKIENATYTTGQPNTITPAQQILINNAITAATGETTIITETNLRDKLQLLRAGFPDAMVSTFTYDPLIGTTSMTDPKGYTTFYEYDSYGRLKQVKNKEGKVLSSNNYHYKNQ